MPYATLFETRRRTSRRAPGFALLLPLSLLLVPACSSSTEDLAIPTFPTDGGAPPTGSDGGKTPLDAGDGVICAETTACPLVHCKCPNGGGGFVEPDVAFCENTRCLSPKEACVKGCAMVLPPWLVDGGAKDGG